jgi:hypothetical protein
MMNRKRYLAIILLTLLPALAAHANAGTALLLGTYMHMLFGNLILGIGEWVLLNAYLRRPEGLGVIALIAGNYLSAWLGGFVIVLGSARFVVLTLENYQMWFYAFVAAAFVVTLIIEFPFVLFAMRKEKPLFKKAVLATLILHLISYSLLFAWYSSLSRDSMVTELELVPAAEMALPDGHSLYYISSDGKAVYRSDLAGIEQKRIKEVDAPERDDCLVLDDSGDLWLYSLWRRDGLEPAEASNMELIVEGASLHTPKLEGVPDLKPSETRWSFGRVPKLDIESVWEYETGFWPAEGIRGNSDRPNSAFLYAMEMPVAWWYVRNATHIEGDYVVFQLGYDQICILQPQDKKIALIARGRGPVVAKDKPEKPF